MSKLTYTINLVMGDWSDDGHGKTDTVTIVCNLDKKALALAYKAGAKKLRVDVSKTVAEEYESATLSKADWKKFAAAGMTLQQLFEHPYFRKEAESGLKDRNMEYIGLDTDAFARLWLFTAKLGNPKFEFAFTRDDQVSINIGGYGLFY